MPLVDRQQKIPLPQQSAGLLMQQPPMAADPAGMGQPGTPQPQGQFPLPNIVQNILSAVDQGSTFGVPGMQGAPPPPNPIPELMIPLLMLTMAAEPGPDVAGPLFKQLGKLAPDALVNALRQLKPGSTEHKLTRAAGLGFDVAEPVYHGTKAEFDAFKDPLKHSSADFGIHVGTQQQANAVAHIGTKFGTDEPYMAGQKILPMFLRKGGTAVVPDLGSWSPSSVLRVIGYGPDDAPGEVDWEGLKTVMRLAGEGGAKASDLENHLDRPFLQDLLDTARKHLHQYGGEASSWKVEFDAVMERHGYDTLAYPNFTESSDGSLSYLVRKPEQLRSIFAQFDPSKMNSSDLLAAMAAVSSIKVLNDKGNDSGN